MKKNHREEEKKHKAQERQARKAEKQKKVDQKKSKERGQKRGNSWDKSSSATNKRSRVDSTLMKTKTLEFNIGRFPQINVLRVLGCMKQNLQSGSSVPMKIARCGAMLSAWK